MPLDTGRATALAVPVGLLLYSCRVTSAQNGYVIKPYLELADISDRIAVCEVWRAVPCVSCMRETVATSGSIDAAYSIEVRATTPATPRRTPDSGASMCHVALS